MHLLVLGGTAFIGHSIVEAALARQWKVTTFNRGRTGKDVPGAEIIRGDRTNQTDLHRLRKAGDWDFIVDTSGYVPRNVLEVSSTLAPTTSHYLFMSTVSVYAGWPVTPLSDNSPVLHCPPTADEYFGEDIEDGPTRYGYQKSGAENAVRVALGEDRSTVLRPGVVLGPREYVGRLAWWLRRIAQGGPVIAPGSPDRSIQPIDVRDLAEFALNCVEQNMSGTYNVTAPIGQHTFADLLFACASSVGQEPDFVWLPDEKLMELGVRQWSEMPLWRTFEGVWRVSSDRAISKGLTSRPLSQTVQDTWTWLTNTPGGQNTHERAAEIGLSKLREQAILRKFK